MPKQIPRERKKQPRPVAAPGKGASRTERGVNHHEEDRFIAGKAP